MQQLTRSNLGGPSNHRCRAGVHARAARPAINGLRSSRVSVTARASADGVDEALVLCKETARTKAVGGDDVVAALLTLEKGMRARAKEDAAVSLDTLRSLNGSWRLIFTTGTIDTQKKTGPVNYFPIKAVQSFDTTASPMRICNAIYLFGNTPAIAFFGEFEWLEDRRKLEFDFDAIAVFGLRFNLPKGGAAKIGASTGLGADSNVANEKKGKKPFFNWISADADVATARLPYFLLRFSLPKGGAAKIGASAGVGTDSNVANGKKGKKPFFHWISADADVATARGGGGGIALWAKDTDTPSPF
eukprot:gene3871-13935_t